MEVSRMINVHDFEVMKQVLSHLKFAKGGKRPFITDDTVHDFENIIIKNRHLDKVDSKSQNRMVSRNGLPKRQKRQT